MNKFQSFEKLLQTIPQLIWNYQILNYMKKDNRKILAPLLKTRLPLVGNVLKSLAKSVLILLGLRAAATDEVRHKKMFGSGVTTLIILNEEMNDIMEIVKSLEESVLLIKGVSDTIKNVAKEQKERFAGMLLGTFRCYFVRKSINR